MKYFFVCFIPLIVILAIALTINAYSGFTNYIAHYAPKGQRGWWKQQGWERFGYPTYSYWETFDNPAPVNPEKKEDPVLEFRPDTPSPTNLSSTTPYHLLEDEFAAPRQIESISNVNSRSCYAADFERMVEKTGNYRQLTNNYKRGYPDSCSAHTQELVLNFYKATPM